MALLSRKRVLAAKIESTAYTAESLASGDAAWQAYDPILQPTIEMIERPQMVSFIKNPDAVGTQMGTMTFSIDLTGDGAGGVPGWADTFLPACGWVKTSSTFNPVTEVPGSNVKTLTMATYVDGLKKAIRGAVGTFTIDLESGKPIRINFTFIGSWTGVSDVSLLSPTLTGDQPLRYANASLSIGLMTPCVSKLTIDAGNNAIMRPCQTASDGSGYRGGLITDRTTTISLDPESALVATQTFQADWLAGTTRLLTTAAEDTNDTVTFSGNVAITNDQEGDRDGIVTDDLTYKIVAPNQLSIAFSAT